MPLHVFHHPDCLQHEAPQEHVERPARLKAVEEALHHVGGTWASAEAASRESLLAIHTEAHVRAVEEACRKAAWLDADTFTGPHSWGAALRGAGLAMAAAQSAASGAPAFALPRPPGHHATRETPMGFCLFNNVALAAEALTRQGQRVAIVDIDVHHGNGTQDIFEARPDVLFVSMHGAPLYPGTGRIDEVGTGPGAGATLNLPVPANTGHEGWVEVFDEAVVPKVRTFAPDVILVSAGYDAHKNDPIGNCLLVAQTYHACVHRLHKLQPRIAAVLEGGYDLEALAVGSAATAAALVGAPSPFDEEPPVGERPWGTMRDAVLRAHPDLR